MAGKIGAGAMRMGDKAIRTKPAANSEEALVSKSKEGKRGRRDAAEREFVASQHQRSVLTEDADVTDQIYKPKTAETRQTYEVLLSFIQEALGDQPRDVLHGAVDEVLCTLKNMEMKDKEKKKETEALLGTSLPDERFALLVNLGKKITDWGADEKMQTG